MAQIIQGPLQFDRPFQNSLFQFFIGLAQGHKRFPQPVGHVLESPRQNTQLMAIVGGRELVNVAVLMELQKGSPIELNHLIGQQLQGMDRPVGQAPTEPAGRRSRRDRPKGHL